MYIRLYPTWQNDSGQVMLIMAKMCFTGEKKINLFKVPYSLLRYIAHE